jgi:hypothetical protein
MSLDPSLFVPLVPLRAPRSGGLVPRIAWIWLGAAAVGCSSGPPADQLLRPVALGMTAKLDPYYADGNLTLYEVQLPVPLPVERPTQLELRTLGAAAKTPPYPRAPFITADDESIEVHFTLSNLDASTHDVWLLFDPWNEFVRYRPGVTVVDDDVPVPNEGYDLGFSVPGNSRVEGDLTSDDTQEMAIKLAAVQSLLSSAQATSSTSSASGDNSLSTTQLANHIFDSQNRSNDGDPLFSPWVPSVIAGLTGFDVGLRTVAQANIAVELTIDIRDVHGNRIVAQDSNAQEIGVPPAVLSPPAARFQ